MAKWPENDLNSNVIGAQISIHSRCHRRRCQQFSFLIIVFRFYFVGSESIFNVYKPLIIIVFTIQINVPFTYIMMYANNEEEQCCGFG